MRDKGSTLDVTVTVGSHLTITKDLSALTQDANAMDDYYTSTDYDFLQSKQGDDDYWEERIKRRNQQYQREHHPERVANNPEAKPCGAFTGRCKKCGSNDLWDDLTVYGCNKCGAMYGN